MNELWGPLLLCILAASATTIGGLLAISTVQLFKTAAGKVISIGLGLSAGVMVYISLVGLLPDALDVSEEASFLPAWAVVLVMFTGVLMVAGIDRAIPKFLNPHEPPTDSPVVGRTVRTAAFTSATAIALHNIPEGFATFTANASGDLATGLGVTVAIAVHNIPEGLAVALPIFAATNSKRKAFLWSVLAGALEPLGALFGLLLIGIPTGGALVIAFAVVAGVMLFVSFDKLLPLATEYADHHYSIYGVMAGLLLMGLTLALVA